MSAEQTVAERNARQFYTVLVALAFVLFALVVRPIAEALFLALVFAGVLYPLQRWLSKRLGGRRNVSAALVTIGFVVVLLTPTIALSTVLVREVIEGGKFVVETLQSDGVMGLVDELPPPMRDVTKDLLGKAPIEPEQLDQAVREKASSQQGRAAHIVQRALTTTGSFLLQASLLVIAMFFLLADGAALVRWCERSSPLRRGQTTELLTEFRKVAVSVIVSSAVTGAVQTAAALIGFLIAGVPHPWFFAVVTFFLSFIPAIGAGGACLAAALLLLATGKVGMAIFLAVWGVLAVGLSDNVVKPLLARRGMQMHGAVVFFALVGGIAAFGALGLILGPLIVSFLLTLVRMGRREDAVDEQAPSPV